MKKYIVLSVLVLIFISLVSLGVGSILASAQTNSAPACVPSSTLRLGSTGEQVVCLQMSLGAGLVADGKFGPRTKAAVVAWQRIKGLVADGIFGPKSRAVFAGGTIIINDPQAPVISGVSGPQALKVDEEGTWTVKASSTTGANLTYSVVWGDENYTSSANTDSLLLRNPSEQSATFTHRYERAGRYTPIFTVTSANTINCITTPCPSNAGSAQASLSVNVSEDGVSQAPVIKSISRPYASVGTQITITGSGFAPKDNYIKFGGGYMGGIPSTSNGTELSFAVPEWLSVCAPYTEMMCRAVAMQVTQGIYEVSVITPDGTSNAVQFTVVSR